MFAVASTLVVSCTPSAQPSPTAEGDKVTASGQEPSIIGMDTPKKGRYPSVGTILLTNQSQTVSARLQTVRLTGADHLEVAAAYVLTMGPNDGTFGGGFFLPPGQEGFPYPHQNREWKTRSPIAGYELAPNAQVNLLVAVDTREACGGSSSGVEVTYEIGGNLQVAASLTGIEMRNDRDPNCRR